MGRKSRAAKASLVAAFVAAGGAAATAKANESPQSARAKAPSRAKSSPLNWGSALSRFIKLDGFPSYLKIDGFAQYNKLLSLDELSAFYYKDQSQVDGLLALYQKGGKTDGLLEGILIGLEQYYKYDDRTALFNFIKGEDALNAYIKFSSFFRAMQADAKNAFSFFYKETGILDVPAVQTGDGEIQ
jgi:hypothetical protein